MRRFILTTLIFILSCGIAYADTAVNNNLKDNLNINLNSRINEKPQNAGFELNEKVLNLSVLPTINNVKYEEGIIYHEDYKPLNAIDPNKNTSVNINYPGLRGPNQLIVYTPAFGLRTGTNEFGTEAIIENNMVVRLNGADSIIPKNGFVISGHGKAKEWITKNIQIGTKIYIDYANNAIRIFLTPESLVFAANEKLKDVSQIVNYYKSHDAKYNDKKALEYLDASKSYLKKAQKKPQKAQMYIKNSMEALDNAMKNAIPCYSDELKGVWIRPVENSKELIEKTVKRINEAGITDIFLETYYHGKTIYPSKYLEAKGVISQREEFVGFDPLAIWIEEAHKRGIKVHIWFESFYVGNENPQFKPNHVLSINPDWVNKRLMNYDSEIPIPSLSEHNGYFLDPANSAVQEYLEGIISEIVENYKPDGINLDYIRYPQTVDTNYSNYAISNWGYTTYARNEFKSLYETDPIDIKYGTDEWSLWSLYRQRKISEFILKVRRITKSHNIKLTAVIFPDLTKSINTKMQNWKDWSTNGYIDGFTPLILTCDKNTATLLLKDIIQNTSPSTQIYPGLFVTFMGGSYDDLLLQIHKSREFKAKGVILFDYAHLNDNYIEALTARVYNKSYTDDVKNNKTYDYRKTSSPNFTVTMKKKEKKRSRNK